MKTSQKIVYVNQSLLNHPSVMEVLDHWNQHDWISLYQRHTFDPGTMSVYCRAGVNNLPFRNDLVELLNCQIPQYDPGFSRSFEEITDMRCQEMRATKFDRPWLIYWSGGIDSTAIVVSVLKNLPQSDWNNIKIVCNRFSVYENPKFFYSHILPNFELIDGSFEQITHDKLINHHLIDGEPADQLFAGGISQSMIFVDSKNGEKSLDHPGELIQYIARKCGRRCAEWYVDSVLSNLKTVDVPVNTYHDFFWWTFFNYSWASIKMRAINHQAVKNCRAYLENFIHWFDHDDYQRWAMVNNQSGIKYGTHPGEYKLAVKNYIFDFDRNEYYRYFKTKTFSDSRSMQGARWFCMLDNYDRLDLVNDSEQILSLLPDHVNG